VTGKVNYQVKGSGGILARNPTPQKAKDVLKGAHSTGGTLIILEEASGLADSIVRACMHVLTGARDRMVGITNPNNPDSYVIRKYQQLTDTGQCDWHITKISWFDMPAYTGEVVPECQAINLLQQKYVDEVISSFGIDSPQYRMFVEAEPDYEDDLSLISISDINVGKNVTLRPTNYDPAPVLGVDVAAHGKRGDDSVIYAGWTKPVEFTEEDDDGNVINTYVRDVTRIRLVDAITTNDVDYINMCRWIIRAALDMGAYEVRIDEAVLGAIILGFLPEVLKEFGNPDISFKGMLGQGHHILPNKYTDDRAWWFGNMQERLAAGEIDIDPEDIRLQRELMSIGYTIDYHKRIHLKPKSGMTKSPDYADASVFCAIYDGDMRVLEGDSAKGQTLIVENDTELGGFDYFDDDPFEKYFPIRGELNLW
jgi:hypothetical protein